MSCADRNQTCPCIGRKSSSPAVEEKGARKKKQVVMSSGGTEGYMMSVGKHKDWRQQGWKAATSQVLVRVCV